jgi:hypothetical protein
MPRYRVDDILFAIRESRGYITEIAERLGCSRQTIYNIAEKSARVKEALEDQREKRLDRAERKLDEAIEQGEAWAICLLLKTMGRHRGYIQKLEVTDPSQETRIQLRWSAYEDIHPADEPMEARVSAMSDTNTPAAPGDDVSEADLEAEAHRLMGEIKKKLGHGE